jgi:cell division protein ZapA
MAPKSTTSVQVEIFGATYRVRGEQNQERLEKLAAIVDKKMREIGGHMPVVDTGKIAVLAALNLADDLLHCQQQQERERAIEQKVTELTEELTDALQGAA